MILCSMHGDGIMAIFRKKKVRPEKAENAAKFAEASAADSGKSSPF